MLFQLLRGVSSVFTIFSVKPLFQAPLSLPADDFGPSIDHAHQNAPQIFNAIHSSMRQWGSSINHNGMSFFRASIPNNTLLYHGTHMNSPVTGMEWLAFEIEHAEFFARTRAASVSFSGQINNHRLDCCPRNLGHSAVFLECVEKCTEDQLAEGYSYHKYLNVYRTKRHLSNILYIDGMSAGKTPMGPLDTQDFILRQNLSASANPIWDKKRAEDLCAIGLVWGFEGIIRMEAGFELILCNFSRNLELLQTNQRPDLGMQEPYNDRQHFEYIRGVSMRYQGIAAGRVVLDYSSMVSAFFYPTNLTNPAAGYAKLPRLKSSNTSVLERIRSDVKKMFLNDGNEPGKSVDWQGVVDMISTRYSKRLEYISSPTSDYTTILSEINVLLTMFMDYRYFDIEDAVENCSAHYLLAVVPRTSQDHLIHAAIFKVTRRICSSLFQARGILLKGEEADGGVVAATKLVVNDLMRYLDWTTWHECGKCAVDEVCFIAMWPWGASIDHKQPRCVKSGYVSVNGPLGGYWWRTGPGLL